MKFSASRTALSGLALTVAATALAQPLLAPAAQAATDVPATSAARAGTGWLATQLTNGVIHNDTFDFDDLGLTMDIGLSMDEVGGDQAMVRQIRSALSTRIDGSTPPPSATERYSGSLAKSLVFAQVSGADPRTYGGLDLVAETEARVTASGPERRSSRRPLRLRRLRQHLRPGARRARPVGGRLRQGRRSHRLPAEAAVLVGLLPGLLHHRRGSGRASRASRAPTPPTPTPPRSSSASWPPPRRAPPPWTPRSTEAVAWLAATQKADGSFVGSTFTPDPNTNSTGLAASALAAAGTCEQAGRAAEWVTSLQVGPQPAGSPLAGEEGALAYDKAATGQRRRRRHPVHGRDQWWRATVQAVAGLTHARGSAKALTVTSSGTAPGSTATLTATGGAVGDRFCLTGPGIQGSRTVVVGSDRTLTSKVVLPAASGAATYTLTGRDGATTHTRRRPARVPARRRPRLGRRGAPRRPRGLPQGRQQGRPRGRRRRPRRTLRAPRPRPRGHHGRGSVGRCADPLGHPPEGHDDRGLRARRLRRPGRRRGPRARQAHAQGLHARQRRSPHPRAGPPPRRPGEGEGDRRRTDARQGTRQRQGPVPRPASPCRTAGPRCACAPWASSPPCAPAPRA